jgi:hypothetical protein
MNAPISIQSMQPPAKAAANRHTKMRIVRVVGLWLAFNSPTHFDNLFEGSITLMLWLRIEAKVVVDRC